MQAISRALLGLAVLLTIAGSYTSVYSSIFSGSLLTVEHIFVNLEIIISVFLAIAVVRNARFLSHLSILLVATFALDLLSKGINDMPVRIMLGFGPHYLKVVPTRSVPEIIDRYDAVIFSTAALFVGLAIKKVIKSHN